MRKTSSEGISLIKKHEGLRLTAYLCPANVWTIGYGHTRTARAGMVITNAQAEELLRQDLATFEKAVNDSVKAPVSQNQFEAMVSLAYNIGGGAFKNSSFLRRFNEGAPLDELKTRFEAWNKAAGKTLTGLVRRRADEWAHFTGQKKNS
jgi:lysozyme